MPPSTTAVGKAWEEAFLDKFIAASSGANTPRSSLDRRDASPSNAAAGGRRGISSAPTSAPTAPKTVR
ncbi:hypothetical protein SMMN14_03813 [Sphaerulina musiva]